MSRRPYQPRRRGRAAFAAVIAVAIIGFGCGTTARRHPAVVVAVVPPNVNPDTLSAAEPMFAMLCAQCHGPNAQGYAADHAPSLVNPTFLEGASDAYLRSSIENGRPGTSMAAYSKSVGGPLGPRAIDRLVQWLRMHGPPLRQLDFVAVGDSARGRAVYAEHCQQCHGDDRRRGDYVMLANPVFLGVATGPFLQHAIVVGRPGTAMPEFGSKLGAQEIADVVAYVRTFAHPVDTSRLPAPTGKEPLFVNPRGRPPHELAIKEGRFVPVDEIKRAIDQKQKLVIIDARPESDWRVAHIAGAVSIPHYQLQRLAEIPKDAWVVAYCACPHHLSGVVVDTLQHRGYTHAMVLDEGIFEWERRGYPIVAASGASLPPLEPAPAPAVTR